MDFRFAFSVLFLRASMDTPWVTNQITGCVEATLYTYNISHILVHRAIPSLLMQVLRAFETGYCQPPPPGCPRNIYKLMVDCWWVQQWLASQNLKLASVTGRYILWGKYNWSFHTVTCRYKLLKWASTFEYFSTRANCNAYSQHYLLSGNLVQKPNQMPLAYCLCLDTPQLSLQSWHISTVLPTHYTLCVYTCWDKSTTNHFPSL